jgi:hypothetical protein
MGSYSPSYADGFRNANVLQRREAGYLVEKIYYRDGSRVLHTYNLLCSVPGNAFYEADDCGVMRLFALPSLEHAFDLNPLSFRSTYCRATSLNLPVAPHHGIFDHSGLELI